MIHSHPRPPSNTLLHHFHTLPLLPSSPHSLPVVPPPSARFHSHELPHAPFLPAISRPLICVWLHSFAPIIICIGIQASGLSLLFWRTGKLVMESQAAGLSLLFGRTGKLVMESQAAGLSLLFCRTGKLVMDIPVQAITILLMECVTQITIVFTYSFGTIFWNIHLEACRFFTTYKYWLAGVPVKGASITGIQTIVPLALWPTAHCSSRALVRRAMFLWHSDPRRIVPLELWPTAHCSSEQGFLTRREFPPWGRMEGQEKVILICKILAFFSF